MEWHTSKLFKSKTRVAIAFIFSFFSVLNPVATSPDSLVELIGGFIGVFIISLIMIEVLYFGWKFTRAHIRI